MTTFEIWFENGPGASGFYSITGNYESAEAVDYFWNDDPFYVGCNELGKDEDWPPRVAVWKQDTGGDFPVSSLGCAQYRLIKQRRRV